MTDLKERGWMGERARVLFCPETLHPSVPLRIGWKQCPGYSCRQPRLVFLHSNNLKQQLTGPQHQVQIQQIGIGGRKLNLSRTLLKAHGVPAACRATDRTSDPFSSRAGVQRGWEAELEITPLLPRESEFKGRFAQWQGIGLNRCYFISLHILTEFSWFYLRKSSSGMNGRFLIPFEPAVYFNLYLMPTVMA